MKSYLSLVPISEKRHHKRSQMTLFCIVLAVALVTVIFGMADMFIRSERTLTIQSSGNWHFAITKVEEAFELIKERPEVKIAGSYEQLSKEITINNKIVGMLGVEEEMVKTVLNSEPVEGAYPKELNEIVLTENAKSGLGLAVGDTLSLDTTQAGEVDFIITGFIPSSSKILKDGTYVMLCTPQSLHHFYQEIDYQGLFLIQFSPYCNMQKAMSQVKTSFDLSDDEVRENSQLLGMMGQSKSGMMQQIYMVAAILFVLVLIAGVLMIKSTLNSNVAQRISFFGMLSCLGATKKQIMRFVRLEALTWCKKAIPIGITIGVIIVWVLCWVLRVLSPMYFANMPRFAVSVPSLIVGALVGLLTVLISAHSPAKKAAKVSPLTAVSGNSMLIKSNVKKAHAKYLKVDIALGMQHAFNNKKNFILMGTSFALSIILFLAFATTVDFMKYAIHPLSPYTPDLSIVSKEQTLSITPEIYDQLSQMPTLKKVYGRMFAYDLPATYLEAKHKINLISYEQHQFNWAEEDLITGQLDAVKAGENAVLMVYDGKNPLQIGDEIIIHLDGKEELVTVVGLLSDSPFSQQGDTQNVICSEELFKKLIDAKGYTIIDMQVKSGLSEAELEEIRGLVGEEMTFSDRRSSNAEVRGTYYCFALFVYGFLVIIVLIAVLNVINSISMSVATRMNQYGAMRAIGMSERQMIKMITAEAVTYAGVGSIIGSGLGIPINKFLYENLVTYKWGTSWELPLGKILIIVGILIVTSFLAVYRPAKSIQQLSIVDTIHAQ